MMILHEEDFYKAVDKYLDENKPDPLSTQQIKGWKFHWNEASNTEKESPSLEFLPEHDLAGTVQWVGEYMQVTLTCRCAWTQGATANEGNLYFTMSARAECTATPTEATKAERKTRQSMLNRLQSDSLIQRLLCQGSDMMPLMEAHIHMHDNGCEEKARCEHDTAEAIQRAVFSTAESPLDVFDLLLSFPMLPCVQYKGGTPLADRARLRLLEDATCDVCEREEEEEMVQELQIQPQAKKKKTKKGDSDEDDD
jgi:hypothetical protein